MTTPNSNPALQAVLNKRKINKSVEVLLGMITGMLADGQLNDLEIRLLKTWLAEHQDVATTWPGSFIAQKLKETLADGHFAGDERDHLQKSLEQLAINDFSQTGSSSSEVIALPFDHDSPVILREAKICLTGDFFFGPRSKCEQVSTMAGAILRNSVTGKTDYLVVGTHILPSWAHTSFGRKIQQAMTVQQEGGKLKIISEERWHSALR